MLKIHLFSIFLSLLVSSSIFSQEKKVCGEVLCLDSIPIVGAEIVLNNSNQIILSDANGKFVLNCHPTDKLKVSANGFYNKIFKVKEGTEFVVLNLKIKPGDKNLAKAKKYILNPEVFQSLVDKNQNVKDFSQYNDMEQLIRVELTRARYNREGEMFVIGVGYVNFLVDDILVAKDVMLAIEPEDVKNIFVIKNKQSTKYARENKQGILVIETKQELLSNSN